MSAFMNSIQYRTTVIVGCSTTHNVMIDHYHFAADKDRSFQHNPSDSFIAGRGAERTLVCPILAQIICNQCVQQVSLVELLGAKLLVLNF